ncbi:MAG: methyltransferase [Pseudothermotoga sp.]
MEDQRSSACDFDENLLKAIKLPDAGRAYRPTHATTLLAWYAKPTKSQKMLVELGAATGAISAYLALNYKCRVVAIEKDKFLASLAQRTVEMNDLQEKVIVYNLSCSEVANVFKAESFDMVIANPPHHLTSIHSPEPVRRGTRSCDFQTAREFVDATEYLLRNKGTFVYILPPTHIVFWLSEFLEKKLQPKRLLPIYGNPQKNAQFLLLKGIKNGGIELLVEPPIVLKRV